MTRDEIRSRRKREVRSKTETLRSISKREVEAERENLRDELRHLEIARPKTRGDCENGIRPCPFVSCRYNLHLEVLETGGIKHVFPDVEPEDMPADKSCALDVADRGGITLEETGEMHNVTREMIRQIEVQAKERMLRGLKRIGVEQDAVAGMIHAEGHADDSSEEGGGGRQGIEEDEPPEEKIRGKAWDLTDGEFPDGTEKIATDRAWWFYMKQASDRGLVKRRPPPKRRFNWMNTKMEKAQEKRKMIADKYVAMKSKLGREPKMKEMIDSFGLDGTPGARSQAINGALRGIRGMHPLPDTRSLPYMEPSPAPSQSRPRTNSDPLIRSLVDRRREYQEKISALDTAIEALEEVG